MTKTITTAPDREQHHINGEATEPTKQRFLEILRRELGRYDWAQDQERLAKAMEYAAQTVNGSRTCRIDGESWKAAWKAIGMKGKPTYKGLHNLCDESNAEGRIL